MSSTHETFHMLEPSNLLEPFDQEDCHNDLANLSARLREDEGPPRGRTRAGRTYASVRIARNRRSPVKAILIVADAVACFGAGAALPQVRNIASGDPAWIAERVKRWADHDAYGIKPQALEPAKPRLPAEPKLSVSNAPNRDAVGRANADLPLVKAASEHDATGVNQAMPVASDPVHTAAEPCDQIRARHEINCLEGAADLARAKPPSGTSDVSPGDTSSIPATSNPTIADAREVAPPMAVGQGGHAQSSRRGRTASWDRHRDRDANRAPSRRRDRAPGEDARAANFWNRPADKLWFWRPDQNSNRTSSSRRGSQEEYARREDRHKAKEGYFGYDRMIVGRTPRYWGPAMAPFAAAGDW